MSALPSAPTVLIVDDSPDTREVMAYVFMDAGFCVCGVGTVEEAIEWLRQKDAPVLIVSDIAMPGRSGVELVAYVRRDAALRLTPIIVVTGRAPKEMTLAVDAVLQKPVDPYDLVESAKKVLALAS